MSMERLTKQECVIMRVIWGVSDITIQELKELLATKCELHYAKSTLMTFLKHLVSKGFIKTVRKGKESHIYVCIGRSDYVQQVLKDLTDFWFDGDKDAFIQVIKEQKRRHSI